MRDGGHRPAFTQRTACSFTLNTHERSCTACLTIRQRHKQACRTQRRVSANIFLHIPFTPRNVLRTNFPPKSNQSRIREEKRVTCGISNQCILGNHQRRHSTRLYVSARSVGFPSQKYLWPLSEKLFSGQQLVLCLLCGPVGPGKHQVGFQLRV